MLKQKTGNINTEKSTNNVIGILSLNYILNNLKINIELKEPGLTAIQLFDIKGVQINYFNLGFMDLGKHTIEKTINLPAGIYFVNLNCGNHSFTQKFVVVR